MERQRNRTRRLLAKSMAFTFLLGTALANAGCFGLISGIMNAAGGLVGSLGGCGGGCGGGGCGGGSCGGGGGG